MENGEPNLYQPPQAELTGAEEAYASDSALPPVPFEDEAAYPAFGSRLWATLKLGYTDPFGLADRVSVTEPILPAWLFNLVFQFPFAIVGLAVGVAIQGLMGRLTGTPTPSNALIQVASVIIGPFVGIFVSSVLLHPFLWLFGGTRQGLGLRQTIRLMDTGAGFWPPSPGCRCLAVSRVWCGSCSSALPWPEPIGRIPGAAFVRCSSPSRSCAFWASWWLWSSRCA